VSEPAGGQQWPSVFGHSKWKHLVRFVLVDEEDVSVKIWQRCVIEFCVKLGKSGNETLEMLCQAHGGETLSRAAIFQWWRNIKDSNTQLIDKARSGRPSTAVTDVNIAMAAELLENDRRLMSHKHSASMKIAFERTQHVVTEILQMRRVCVCVPGGYPGISQNSRCNDEFRCAPTLFKCLRRFRIS